MFDCSQDIFLKYVDHVVFQVFDAHQKILLVIDASNDGNRTEWSPIRSVIIRVINKLVNQEYDYRLNWTKRCPVTNY